MEIYTEGDTNTYGQLYCASGGLLDSDNNSNGNGNFKITAHLEEMKRYYIAVSHNSSTGYGDYTLRFKFVKDYFEIPSGYASSALKEIIGWWNDSYTSHPDWSTNNTSVKYRMYMNKESAKDWDDYYIENKSIGQALREAIQSTIEDEMRNVLNSSGFSVSSSSNIAMDLVVNFIVALLTPYLQKAMFKSERNKMTSADLLAAELYTIRYAVEGSLFEYTYEDTYDFYITNSNYLYGAEFHRGKWERLPFNHSNIQY